MEIYATVFDSKGRYLDGLTREQFTVLDNEQPQTIEAFESSTAGLSCAILLDHTGSMADALPVVKNAVVKLIDQLRADDWVAVYSFSTNLHTLQRFTRDKQVAKQAVLRTRAEGSTALFDAISHVAGDASKRTGKKAIVVFTDGQDNASVLNAAAATARATKVGVPVYTVAEGEALKSVRLLRLLKDIAQSTGGRSYSVRRAREVEDVFVDISHDMQHTYLLAYKAPPSPEATWRTVRLSVRGIGDYKIRAKEGYFPK